jgi:hypothetical protein
MKKTYMVISVINQLLIIRKYLISTGWPNINVLLTKTEISIIMEQFYGVPWLSQWVMSVF